MKVRDIIEKLQKYDPETTIKIWDGNRFYDAEWKFSELDGEVDFDGTIYNAVVSLDLDDVFEEFWWVPTTLSDSEKLEWIDTIHNCTSPE